jgi:catechol 2,3-dioxygenase-like lactoylglutathione lyase family enzyme
MAATLAFYRLLGLDIPPGADEEDYVSFDLPGGIRMAWNTAAIERSFNPDWRPPDLPGRMGVTFRYNRPDEVDRTHELLVGAGYQSSLAPFDAPWGTRHCRVIDPDGNAIDLFAESPIDTRGPHLTSSATRSAVPLRRLGMACEYVKIICSTHAPTMTADLLVVSG